MKVDEGGPETVGRAEDGAGTRRTYCFAGYVLDSSRWQLQWQGEPVTIHRKSFDLLLYLIGKRPAVVSKEELLAALWPDQFVEENNLAQQVSILRRALSRGGSRLAVIETVPGRGYRFAAEVEEVPAVTGSILAVPPTGQHGPALNGRRRWLGWQVGIAVLVAGTAIAGAFGWWWWVQNHTGGPPVQAVLMDLEGGTGDAVLDQALRAAVQFDFTQSPFVTVVSPAVVRKTLQLMRRDLDQPLTPATANEVCERTESQAVIRTVLAREGSHFLLTGEATSCVNGSLLISSVEEVQRREDLRIAVNRLVGRLRTRLGESRRSVERFTTPRFALETASLEALKAASLGTRLNEQGKAEEAIPLLKQAVAYDRNFAEGYYNLSSAYISLQDRADAKASIEAAYQQRATTSPFVQLAIVQRYSYLVTGDLYEAERNAVLWTELYPKIAAAWNSLANIRKDLGQFPGAVEAAGRASHLRPDSAVYIAAYAQEQMRTGDLRGSQRSCQQALAINPDFDFAHLLLARLAFTLGDQTLAQQQRAWLAAHPGSPETVSAEAEIAFAEGRLKEGKDLVNHYADVSARQGNSAASDVIKQIALELLVAGDRQGAEAMFRKQPFDAESPDDVLMLAALGDAKAEMLVHGLEEKNPQSTLMHGWYGPLVEGWSALNAGNPKMTIAVLDRPGVLAGRNLQVPLLRGEAYLADRQPRQAQTEFETMLHHTELEHSSLLTVGWLELARARAAQGDRKGAGDAYRRFLDYWAKADGSAALRHAAEDELASLKDDAR